MEVWKLHSRWWIAMRSRIAALVLKQLAKEPATWKELCESTGAEPGYLSIILTRLRGIGLIERTLEQRETGVCRTFKIKSASYKECNRLLLDA
jgi:hypothetical protein